PDATLVAGATDVGLWITKALQPIEKVIWLGRVAGLDALAETPGALAIGATVRRFGSWQVRASGTVGGNIANGSPIGDLAPALIALDATVDLRRGDDL